MNEERFKLEVDGVGAVSAVVCLPQEEKPEVAVVVAHGQANDLDHDLLMAFSDGLAERGYASLRFNFPYKEAGKKSPDNRGKLVKTYMAARAELERRTDDARTVLAGKSLGARIASYAATEEPAAGLVFLGYAIHAPGKEPAEYEHLLKIEAPALFFAGTRDPLCKIDKLEKILEQRSAPTSLQIVEGGNHGFAPPKGDDRPVEMIYENMASVTADWIDEYI